MSSGEQTGINWVQVIGAALAAVSSAVLLSTLGVAGTIIGAAVGSIIASVGGALYSRGINASQQQVAAQAAALRRATQARARGPEGTAAMDAVPTDPATDTMTGQPGQPGGEPGDPGEVDADSADQETGDADQDLGEPDEGAEEEHKSDLYQAEPGKPLPWKRLAVIALGLFVVVMVTITAFELLTGKPVSAITGGSDDTGTTLFERKTESDKPSPTPSDGTGSTPTDGSSASETATGDASPTGTATGLPTSTETPTGTPTPTDEASPTGVASSEPAG